MGSEYNMLFISNEAMRRFNMSFIDIRKHIMIESLENDMFKVATNHASVTAAAVLGQTW